MTRRWLRCTSAPRTANKPPRLQTASLHVRREVCDARTSVTAIVGQNHIPDRAGARVVTSAPLMLRACAALGRLKRATSLSRPPMLPRLASWLEVDEEVSAGVHVLLLSRTHQHSDQQQRVSKDRHRCQNISTHALLDGNDQVVQVASRLYEIVFDEQDIE